MSHFHLYGDLVGLLFGIYLRLSYLIQNSQCNNPPRYVIELLDI